MKNKQKEFDEVVAFIQLCAREMMAWKVALKVAKDRLKALQNE